MQNLPHRDGVADGGDGDPIAGDRRVPQYDRLELPALIRDAWYLSLRSLPQLPLRQRVPVPQQVLQWGLWPHLQTGVTLRWMIKSKMDCSKMKPNFKSNLNWNIISWCCFRWRNHFNNILKWESRLWTFSSLYVFCLVYLCYLGHMTLASQVGL